MLALSYFARKSPKKKMVNFLFNLDNIFFQKTKLNKKKTKMEKYKTKLFYNHKHNFIDSVKHIISKCRNVLRARRAWRVKLNSWMYVYQQSNHRNFNKKTRIFKFFNNF